MNYEEKYKQALETVQEILSSGADAIRIKRLKLRLQSVFPELLEREDEIIKNEIIAFVEQSIHRGGGTPIPQEQENKWLAWLEKQGEQNTLEMRGNQVTSEIIKNQKEMPSEFTQLVHAKLWDLIKAGHKMLDADKVIEWLDEHVPTKFEDMTNYVQQFKQDFGL